MTTTTSTTNFNVNVMNDNGKTISMGQTELLRLFKKLSLLLHHFALLFGAQSSRPVTGPDSCSAALVHVLCVSLSNADKASVHEVRGGTGHNVNAKKKRMHTRKTGKKSFCSAARSCSSSAQRTFNLQKFYIFFFIR